MVGASGSILNHRQGRFIDGHDVVIRPTNPNPTPNPKSNPNPNPNPNQLSVNVARDKDDEVNRFMRHEVKNCIRLQPHLRMVAAFIMGLQPLPHRVAASATYGCR